MEKTSVLVSGNSESFYLGVLHYCRAFSAGTDAYQMILSNIAIGLIIISAIYLIPKFIYRRFRPKNREIRLTSSHLYSKSHASDLSKLESDVIISSVASNLLPAHLDQSPEQPVPPNQAGRVIEDFKALPLTVKRWERVRRGVLLVGAAVWVGVSVARCVFSGHWKGLAYPVCHF